MRASRSIKTAPEVLDGGAETEKSEVFILGLAFIDMLVGREVDFFEGRGQWITVTAEGGKGGAPSL